MKKVFVYLFILGITYFLTSCSLEKEIDLDLPDYENKLMVECYLEPGQPFRVALTESLSYFDPRILPPPVDSALVIIKHNGISDTLKNGRFLGLGGKGFNYSTINLVPADYTSEFTLHIIDRAGRTITGRTTIPAPISIDTVEFRYNKDSLAFPLTKFYDNTSVRNYYRYQATRDTYDGDELTDFIFDDELITSSQIILGSSYELEKNEVAIITLYNINKDYFDFLESVGAAVDANGNPFGQPATVKSNVEGGLGIFTGLSYDRKILNTP